MSHVYDRDQRIALTAKSSNWIKQFCPNLSNRIQGKSFCFSSISFLVPFHNSLHKFIKKFIVFRSSNTFLSQTQIIFILEKILLEIHDSSFEMQIISVLLHYSFQHREWSANNIPVEHQPMPCINSVYRRVYPYRYSRDLQDLEYVHHQWRQWPKIQIEIDEKHSNFETHANIIDRPIIKDIIDMTFI